MQWDVMPARSRFHDYMVAWDDLNSRGFRRHPLLDSRFVESLIAHFSTDREMLTVGHAHGQVQAMLILSHAMPGIMRTFLPSQAPIGLAMLDSIEGLPSLLRRLPGTTVALELRCQDPEYSCFPASSCDVAHELTHYGTTVSIAIDGCFDTYWAARPAKFQQNIARALRRTSSETRPTRLQTVSSAAEISEAVDRFGDLEIRGWKGANGTAVHRSNAQGRFYRDVLQRFAEAGHAKVYELFAGDSLIASQLAISNDFMLITLKTTHDETFRSYSPGHLLDYLMLQHEFEQRRYRTVEFYTNADSLLRKWGTATREIQHITVYRNARWHRVAQSARRIKQRLRRAVTQSDSNSPQKQVSGP